MTSLVLSLVQVLPLFLMGVNPMVEAGSKGAKLGWFSLQITDEKGEAIPCFVALQEKESGEFFPLQQPHIRALSPFTSARVQWQGKHPTDCDGSLDVDIPAGEWIVWVGKGLEYVPNISEVTVSAIRKNAHSVVLKRFVDMPSRGWWSGDAHAHVPRPDRSVDPHILLAAKAEDVHMTNILTYGDIHGVYYEQYAFGREGTVSDGDFWIVPGQEEPRTGFLGHTVMLNVPEFVRFQEEYYLYDRVFKKARELGGLAGYAHFFGVGFPAKGPVFDYRGPRVDIDRWDGNNYSVATLFNSDNGGALDFPDGIVDFVEGLGLNGARILPRPYYDVLNLGFRVSLTAGSDFPWGGHIGDQRVYVRLDRGEPLTPAAWFDGVKAGKTFITHGPLMYLKVENEDIGSEVAVSKDDVVTIKARAFGHPKVASPKRLDLVLFGEVIASVTSEDPLLEFLEIIHDLPVEESFWVAARAQGHNGSIGHTSPIYVVADGAPILASEKVDETVAAFLRRLKHTRKVVEKRVEDEDPAWTPIAEDFFGRIDRAETFYRGLVENASSR